MTFRHIKTAAIKKEKMFIKNLQKHLSYSYPPLSIKNKRSIKNHKVPMPNFFMSQDQVCFFGSILSTYLGQKFAAGKKYQKSIRANFVEN